MSTERKLSITPRPPSTKKKIPPRFRSAYKRKLSSPRTLKGSREREIISSPNMREEYSDIKKHCNKFRNLNKSEDRIRQQFTNVYNKLKDRISELRFFDDEDFRFVVITIIDEFIGKEFYYWLFVLGINIRYVRRFVINKDVNIAANCQIQDGNRICNTDIILTASLTWLSRKDIKVSGKECKTELMCLIYNISHEIVHILQYILCSDKLGHDDIFIELARSIFGFTNYKIIV